MMGQANHFNRYASEAVPYGSWRYTSEARRLNHVLNEQLVSVYLAILVHTVLHLLTQSCPQVHFAVHCRGSHHSSRHCSVYFRPLCQVVRRRHQ